MQYPLFLYGLEIVGVTQGGLSIFCYHVGVMFKGKIMHAGVNKKDEQRKKKLDLLQLIHSLMYM